MRILSLLAGVLLAWSAAGAERRFNFGEYPEGAQPTNYSSGRLGDGLPGAWKIVMDEVPSALAPLTEKAPVVTRHGVLAQTSQDLTDERFPMLVYDGEMFRNFKFSTRFKIVSGVVEQMAGVVFRFQNVSNFYVVRISALGKNIAFYKMINGKIETPIKLPLEISAGAWHELKVECSGIYVEVSVDGRKTFPTITDSSPPDGKIGFWTKSDSVSYFADAVVDYTPLIPAAQVMVNSVMAQQSHILGLRIYTLGTNGTTSVLASKEPSEIGQPGTDAEVAAIRDGTISFGRERGAVLLTLPLHDRNGDYIAAVRVKLKSFFGETQNTAVTRASNVVKLLQLLCSSASDLQK